MANEDIKTIIRRLDGIIDSYDEATASISRGNGDEVLFTITTTNDAGAKVLVVPDIALYIGSVAATNQLPGGSGIDESQWQVIGPFTDWGSTDNINSVSKVYVRNISAGTVTVIIKVIARVITNTGTPAGSLS